MLIEEIQNCLKEVFKEEKGVVKTIDSVYEKTDEDYFRLVISIHNLSVEDSVIIHTKFIFRTDTVKANIIENSFNYLYDINCIYRKVEFSDISNLKEKLEKIIESNKFGKDIQIISEFIDTPSRLLNSYFNKNNITKYTVNTVVYEPKFKIVPCSETTFDFNINVNGDYDINLTISKNNDIEEIRYKFRFKLLDNTEVVEVDTLTNMHYLIGGKLIELLDKFLKSILFSILFSILYLFLILFLFIKSYYNNNRKI